MLGDLLIYKISTDHATKRLKKSRKSENHRHGLLWLHWCELTCFRTSQSGSLQATRVKQRFRSFRHFGVRLSQFCSNTVEGSVMKASCVLTCTSNRRFLVNKRWLYTSPQRQTRKPSSQKPVASTSDLLHRLGYSKSVLTVCLLFMLCSCVTVCVFVCVCVCVCEMLVIYVRGLCVCV